MMANRHQVHQARRGALGETAPLYGEYILLAYTLPALTCTDIFPTRLAKGGDARPRAGAQRRGGRCTRRTSGPDTPQGICEGLRGKNAYVGGVRVMQATLVSLLKDWRLSEQLYARGKVHQALNRPRSDCE